MRTIAIGDIHGCAQALAALLELVAPTSNDRVIFLGDYIDRGPDTRGVLDRVLALCDQCEVISLLGNHETMLLESLQKGSPLSFWLAQCGGSSTLSSYGGALKNIPGAHVDFLARCRRFFETNSHLFVHANYNAHQPLEEQSDEVLLWQHLSWSVPLPHRSGKQVIVGHTPQRSGLMLDLGHLRCIDTACFAGGWLTALDVETSQTWQANQAGETRGTTDRT